MRRFFFPPSLSRSFLLDEESKFVFKTDCYQPTSPIDILDEEGPIRRKQNNGFSRQSTSRTAVLQSIKQQFSIESKSSSSGTDSTDTVDRKGKTTWCPLSLLPRGITWGRRIHQDSQHRANDSSRYLSLCTLLCLSCERSNMILCVCICESIQPADWYANAPFPSSRVGSERTRDHHLWISLSNAIMWSSHRSTRCSRGLHSTEDTSRFSCPRWFGSLGKPSGCSAWFVSTVVQISSDPLVRL